MEIFDLKDKKEFLNEIMELELMEWTDKPIINKEERIKSKINKYLEYETNIAFCKLILVENNELIGFISIFPFDCMDEPNLTPWYATMFVKKEHRGKGYSKVLNDAILKEAKKRGFKEIYLKTELNNYYEKFGAIYVKQLNEKEKIMKFNIN